MENGLSITRFWIRSEKYEDCKKQDIPWTSASLPWMISQGLHGMQHQQASPR
jgi:hypothetical protein